MEIRSTRFGTFEVADDSVVTFPDGVPGLPGERYVLVSKDEDSPFYWLHSAEHEDVALPVTNPWLFYPEYEVRVSDEDSRRLGLSSPGDATILCVVRATASPEDCSVNLAGPVVIHQHHKVGRQILNDAGGYSVRHPLFSEVELAQAKVAV
jgi:flagellar assembly factor FliW